jgi:hypothetical protein
MEMKFKVKHYKIGGNYFAVDNRFGRFEAFQNKLNELGLDMELFKGVLLGNENNPEKIIQFGLESAIRLFTADNLRSLLATILVHKPLIYRLPIIGEYLFNKFDRYSENQIEETKKMLLNGSLAEADQVMNDFFVGMMNSMLLSFQNSKG